MRVSTAVGRASIAIVAAMAATITVPAVSIAASFSGQASRSQATSQCAQGTVGLLNTTPWAQKMLQPASAWPLATGAGQLVAVLDSGVSASAPALSGAVLPGLNAVSGGAADTDCLGHGTFVAGVIAARPTSGSAFTGVAPAARILPVNVVTLDQETTAGEVVTAAAVATGIRYAVHSGATVIDVSPAVTPGPGPALQAAVAYALARNVVVIAPVAISDTSTPANQVSYPAAYPGVVAVAAVTSSGAPIAAGAPGVHVDLAAPGYQVQSISPTGTGGLTDTGAAAATGFVAGAAALVRSYYPRLTAAQVVQRLEATANQPGTSLPDPELGYGIVDPYTAVTTVLPSGSAAVAASSPAPRLADSPPPADRWPVTAAVLVCVVLLVAVVTGLGAAYTVQRGRRRGWRPPHISSQSAGGRHGAGEPSAGQLPSATRRPPPSKSGHGQG
jgi:membrane-anchored mycosin MYCP